MLKNNLPSSDYKNYSSLKEAVYDVKNNIISLPAVWKVQNLGMMVKEKILKTLDDLFNLPNGMFNRRKSRN